MISNHYLHIEECLSAVLAELQPQVELAPQFSEESLSFRDWIKQLDEWINDAGEYGSAYESIVSTIELYEFKISGPSVVRLLEVGLIFKYKTERDADSIYDSRER